MERKRKLLLPPKAKEHLICAICTDHFDDPRNLVCGHVFCMKCLDRLYKTDPRSQKISCPTCRKVTKIREKGVDGLSRNLPILGLLDQDLSEEPGPSSKRYNETPTCSEHNQEHRGIYCRPCKVFICFQCFQEKHVDHVTKSRNRFMGELNQKTNDAKKQFQVQSETLENNLLEADQEIHKLVLDHKDKKLLAEKNHEYKLTQLKQEHTSYLQFLTITQQRLESDVAQFKKDGEQLKESLAIAVPKLESKTLEDLDDEDLKSYVKNVDNVMDLLKTDIGVEHLKLWNKPFVPSTSARPQPRSIPSTSGGTAGQAPKSVDPNSLNKSL